MQPTESIRTLADFYALHIMYENDQVLAKETEKYIYEEFHPRKKRESYLIDMTRLSENIRCCGVIL